MSIGNPLELITIGAFKIPRYKVATIFLGGLAGAYILNSQLAKFRPKKVAAPLPKDEQEFVDAYIIQAHKDKDIPAWIKGDRDYVPGGH